MNTEGKIAYIAVTSRGTVLAQKLKGLMGTGGVYTTAKVKALLGEQLKKAELSPAEEDRVKAELSPAEEDKVKAELSPVKEDKVKAELSPVEGDREKVELSPREEDGVKAELSLQEQEGVRVIEGTLGEFTEELFASYETLVFIMATGIVVRVIAPYVASKFSDPAVIVLDECGEQAISLLSGHMGGANEMTRKISHLIGANPVITTATDVNQKAAVDCIIKDLNAYTENLRESVKKVNYALVQDEEVGLYIKGDYQVDERGFIRLDGLEEEQLKEKLVQMKYVVYISCEADCEIKELVDSSKLIWVIPRCFALGIGCKKDTPIEHMRTSFESYMRKHNVNPHSIKALGSIEIKKDEEAIKVLAKRLKVPFKIFSREELAEVEHLFEGSDFVKKTIGVSCVAEPSAYLLGVHKVLISKEKYNGITFALGKA